MRFIGIFVGFLQILSTTSMVLRFTDKGLHRLASYTRVWMNQTIREIHIEEYAHRIQRGIAAGELNLQNITVREFIPPLIRYRSSEHALYMTTVGGEARLQAEWELDSPFLAMLALPFQGQVKSTISGLQSEIAVHIMPGSNEFVVHHCTAKFVDFGLKLSGSVAADFLHLFRAILGKAMKRRVEETYCRMITNKLLPWLQHQITRFPSYLEINFDKNVRLSQALHSIVMSNTFIDLRMKNKFETNGHLIETLSTLPASFPEELSSLENQRMLELFIDEPTLQEIISAAHFSDLLIANITSPFLRTECDMLCLGTLFPELAEELGPTSLIVIVKTVSTPIIKLLENHAFMFLNCSVEMYDSRTFKNPSSSGKSDSRDENVSRDIIDNNVDITNPVVRDPVISVEVSGEAALGMVIRDSRLEGRLKLKNTKAIVLESKLVDMSQKTVDFIVNLATPFLEDAVELFFGNGIAINQIFKVDSRNESLSVHEGFVRLQTDLFLEDVLSYSSFS
uniref:BPI2 domain-containing protein n=1 Tax=Panagrellus redivivus TaxID=6233 RepID=A0A7E4VKE7_PANRE